MDKDDNLKTPYELFGVECESGWDEILKPIFEYVENYNKDKDYDDRLEILQIKEKFGTLRIYCNFYTEKLRNLIEKAEEESINTCECCGTHENLGWTSGWIKRLCKGCSEKSSHLKWKQDKK